MENIGDSRGEEIIDNRRGGHEWKKQVHLLKKFWYWVHNSEEIADSWCKMLTRFKSY